MFSPKAAGDRISPDVSREMELIANISDELEVLAAIYDGYEVSCYVASEHGYMIEADAVSTEEAYQRIFTEEFLLGYDPRERSWYNEAEEAGKPVLSNIYVGNDGHTEITCAAPYYKNNVFAGAVGIDLHLDALSRLLSDRTLGKMRNISFGLNEDGVILFSTEREGALAVSAGLSDLRQSPEPSLAREAARMVAGEMDIAPVTMDGEEYYIAFAPMPKIGWSYGMLIRKEDAMQGARGARASILAQSAGFAGSMRSFFWDNLLQIAALLLVILFLMVRASEKATAHFAGPILALTEGVRKIARGDLDTKLDIRTGDELEDLADAVNAMSGKLKTYTENIAREVADKKRIATELNLAQGIQEGMLPDISKFAADSRFDLWATMEPAKEVGGDFYDFYMMDGGRLAITVADVSGKSVPAAMFMVISKTVLKNIALSTDSGEDFGRAMERTNLQLCEDNEEMMFVTVFFGVLDLRTGEFVYVNGGHNPPLVGRARDGAADWQYIRDEMKTHMVGVLEDAGYEEKRLTLAPGDMLYFYTDGVTEAMDAEKRLYTEERLQQTLNRVGTPDAPVKYVLAAVRADIGAHTGGAEQSDDITMLGLRYLG